MPRIRTIKPEFWSDEKLAECDPITRLVFLGLIGMADDCGRVLDNTKVIDAFVFPATSDTCRESVATLSRMRRIRRGTTSSGQKVIQIVNWEKHQRVDKPNLLSALPEINGTHEVTEIREEVANGSREIRESASTRPTTYDLGSTTNDLRPTTTKAREKRNGFKKPTIEDVAAYCRERSNAVDPQSWMDHYTANGWRVGRNAMKDWKAAVRTWEKNHPTPASRILTAEEMAEYSPGTGGSDR